MDKACQKRRRSRSRSGEDPPSKKVKKPAEPMVLMLTTLPPEILEHIISFLPYTNIAKVRMVCRVICHAGNNLLRKGFQKVQTLVTHRVAELKLQMPRRESVRHKHPLARECDIYQSINVKLSLLRLHFGKYITAGACSFYPGQVLDEVRSIMNYIQTSKGELDYAYVVTTELSDLCHMAIEYHNDHLPKMPKHQSTAPAVSLPFELPGVSSTSGLHSSCSSGRSGQIEASQRRIRQSMDRVTQIMNWAKQGSGLSADKEERPPEKHFKCRRKINLMNQRLILVQKSVKHYRNKVTRYERHFQDLARKVDTLTKELAECKDEIKDIKESSQA